MKKLSALGCALLLGISLQPLQAQYAAEDSTYYRYFAGTTLFVLANAFPDDNAPDFVQLNLGYRISRKDAVSLELKTWKYAWPLGIPYGDSFEAPEERFPGYIREWGVAFVYQRFWWKGLFTGIHCMAAFQSFHNPEGQRIDRGFQVFATYRAGYHIRFFRDRFFFQPSLAITHRPYYTPMPDAFARVDSRWPVFFFGEPGLHVGYNF